MDEFLFKAMLFCEITKKKKKFNLKKNFSSMDEDELQQF